MFFAEVEQVIPWSDLTADIKPYYPKAKGAGRRSMGVERMLRISFLQHWFKPSYKAVEEAPYNSRAMQQFVRIDLGWESVPDETMSCKFRNPLEAYQLDEQGLQISGGTIVDATIITAPSSTTNRQKAAIRRCIRRRRGTVAFRHEGAYRSR